MYDKEKKRKVRSKLCNSYNEWDNLHTLSHLIVGTAL